MYLYEYVPVVLRFVDHACSLNVKYRCRSSQPLTEHVLENNEQEVENLMLHLFCNYLYYSRLFIFIFSMLYMFLLFAGYVNIKIMIISKF